MINCLTCDINRRIYMSYDPLERCPESRTAQSGSQPVARTTTPSRSRRTTRPGLFHLQAAGLSLSPTGSATQATSPGQRCESVLHCQAFPQPGRQAPRVRRFHRIDLERNRQPCLLSGIASRGRSWLSGHQIDNARCDWNTNLIDCCQTSWHRPMNCSCPAESVRQGRLPPRRPVAARRF